jgi:hypothetical protein
MLPVALVNSKDLFIERKKDLTAKCTLPECILFVHSYERAIYKQSMSRTIIESFISVSTSVTVAALLTLPCSAN